MPFAKKNELPIVVFEVFAGTRSIGRAAERLGNVQVYSLEIDPRFGCNLTGDYLGFEVIAEIVKGNIPMPDIVWMSPVCTSFSRAA